MDDNSNCLICDLTSVKSGYMVYRIKLFTHEKEKLICFSKVKRDDKLIKFQNSRGYLDMHNTCFTTYLPWEQTIREREAYENSQETSSNDSTNEVFLYFHCIFCGSDTSDDFIKKGIKNLNLITRLL